MRVDAIFELQSRRESGGSGHPLLRHRESQGVVAADEWTRFLEEIVTPRFPRALPSCKVWGNGVERGVDHSGIHLHSPARPLPTTHRARSPWPRSWPPTRRRTSKRRCLGGQDERLLIRSDCGIHRRIPKNRRNASRNQEAAVNLHMSGLPVLIVQVGFIVVFSAPVWLAARIVGRITRP